MADVKIEPKITMDLLDVKRPSTSATTDIPVIETKPDASPEKPAAPEAPEKTEAEDIITEESATPEKPEDSSASAEPKKAKGVQKRIDELTKQREDERRRAEAAEARMDRALAALEKSTGTSAKETKEVINETDPEPAKPVKSEFTDPDAYDTALSAYYDQKTAWTVRREVKAGIADEQRKLAEVNIANQQKSVRDAHLARVEKITEKYADYKEVAESPDVIISIPMAHTILTSEQGPEIAYYLGKNPAEAKRISSITTFDANGNVTPDANRQLLELGLILAKINTPPVKPPVSGAPKPIKPLSSGSDTSQKSPEDETMEEYYKRRHKELSEERRPGGRH